MQDQVHCIYAQAEGASFNEALWKQSSLGKWGETFGKHGGKQVKWNAPGYKTEKSPVHCEEQRSDTRVQLRPP